MAYTIQELFSRIVLELSGVQPDAVGAAQEASWLLAHVTGKTQAQLMANSHSELSLEQVALVQQLVHDRVHNHKPLQYILGSVPFGDLTLLVRPPVFIPRPETEEWLITVTQHLAALREQPLRILDLCTGSGCVALYLASKFPHAQVTGIDKNPEAIKLAQENAEKNGITNCLFEQKDIFIDALPHGQFDVLVSNPPYLSEQEWCQLDRSCLAWEDKAAFVGQDEGMKFYHWLLASSKYLLSNKKEFQEGRHASLFFEIGPAQIDLVSIALCDYGLSKAWTGNDMQGKERWFFGCR